MRFNSLVCLLFAFTQGCKPKALTPAPETASNMLQVELMATRAIRSAYVKDLDPPSEEEYQKALSQLSREQQINSLTKVFEMVTTEEEFWKIIDPNHPEQFNEFMNLESSERLKVARAQAIQSLG